MKNFLLVIFGILLIALLSLVCFNNKLESIKDYLISITQNKLNQNSILGLDVDVVGKGYKTELATKISGVVFSDEEKEKALEVAESVDSVFYVKDNIKVEKPKVIKKGLLFEPVEVEKPKKVETKPEEVVQQCQDRLNKLLKENKIHFKSSDSIINSNSFELLNTIADIIKECNNSVSKIEIAGYTDSSGSKKLNQMLSLKRAEAVRNYLILRGLSKELFKVKGYGSKNPIADNNTAIGRSKNRRIEFKLIK